MNLREFKGWFEKNVQFHIVNFPFQFLHLFGDFPGRFAHPCARWQFENDRHTAWKPLKPRKPWHSSDKTHMARIHVYVFLVCYVIYIIYNYIYILYERTAYHIFANYIYRIYQYITYWVIHNFLRNREKLLNLPIISHWFSLYIHDIGRGYNIPMNGISPIISF